MGFNQSWLDPALQYKLNESNNGYDYIAHHVDDFIIASGNLEEYLSQLKQKYSITGGEIPDMYLGITTKVSNTEECWIFSTEQYLQKALKNVEKILGSNLGKQSTPNLVEFHPEEEDSPILDEVYRNKYQQLIGIGIWLNTIGRLIIC